MTVRKNHGFDRADVDPEDVHIVEQRGGTRPRIEEDVTVNEGRKPPAGIPSPRTRSLS